MSKPEINWHEFYAAASDYVEHGHDDTLRHVVSTLRDETYEAGRQDVLREGAARAAMLEQQAEWFDTAAKADGPVGKVVAGVVAGAFATAADAYRTTPKPTLEEPPAQEPTTAGEGLEAFDNLRTTS